jgi:hypothetical protein
MAGCTGLLKNNSLCPVFPRFFHISQRRAGGGGADGGDQANIVCATRAVTKPGQFPNIT